MINFAVEELRMKASFMAEVGKLSIKLLYIAIRLLQIG